jgi:hypothetical protein
MTQRRGASFLVAVCASLFAASASAQTFVSEVPDEDAVNASQEVLSGECRPRSSCEKRGGFAASLFGTSGIFVPSDHGMDAITDRPELAALTARFDGVGPYLGAGLRLLYMGEIARAGMSFGAFQVDRGLTLLSSSEPGSVVRPTSSYGGHVELFVGGELDLRPVYPYADLAGWFDVVHSDVVLSTADGTSVTNGYRSLLWGLGPRAGILVPVSRHLFFDAAATAGVLGPNRFAFTAGFGFQIERRPPVDHCDSHCR